MTIFQIFTNLQGTISYTQQEEKSSKCSLRESYIHHLNINKSPS